VNQGKLGPCGGPRNCASVSVYRNSKKAASDFRIVTLYATRPVKLPGVFERGVSFHETSDEKKGCVFFVFFCFFKHGSEQRGGGRMLDQALLEEVILFMEQPDQQRTRRVPPCENELMELMLHPAFQLPEPREQPEPQKATPAPVDDLPEGFWRLTQVIEQLRRERAARGLSLDWLRQQSGISRGRLSLLENRVEFNPTIGTLERIAEALGVRLLVKLERTREVGTPLALRQLLGQPAAFAAKVTAGVKQPGGNAEVTERGQQECSGAIQPGPGSEQEQDKAKEQEDRSQGDQAAHYEEKVPDPAVRA